MTERPAEERARNFYEQHGWKFAETGATFDSELWEDLRACAVDYVSHCRRRVFERLPARGERILDAASGPVQYPEYVEYSKNFSKRFCVDISTTALELAKQKLGDHAETVCTSILNLPFPDDHFDAVVSLHTIYHIDKDDQEAAVRQLLRVARPGAPVIIVYFNPDRFLSRIGRLRRIGRPNAPRRDPSKDPLYFFAHPLSWWNRFEDTAELEITSWRLLLASDAKRLIPGNGLGRLMLDGIGRVERRFPKASAWAGAYPMVVLSMRS